MIEVNGVAYEYKLFPDGTPLMKYPVDPDTDDIQYRITWMYENIAEQIVLQFLVWHIQEKNPDAKITLLLPYIPNARMDRTHNDDEIFTLKYFAKFINQFGFHRVYALDPHSSVSTALINNITISDNLFLSLVQTVIDAVKPDFLYYPDIGCQKRLETLIRYPNIVGHKTRDWDTGKILGTEVLGADKLDLKDKRILIVDDISSYGGTFLYAAQKLKELGAGTLFLYITHCENSILKGDLINSDLIHRIYTTNTIFTGEHRLIDVMKIQGIVGR